MRIGCHALSAPTALAPMAGVTDRPFRVLCRRLGAGVAASEMLTSDTRLWRSRKSQRRMNHEGEPSPRVVQLAGSDPQALAEAAQLNVDLGAEIIDINMGCPAKKVFNKHCGSALLADEPLVARILAAVVGAVAVPVTLKMRTGVDGAHRNGVTLHASRPRAASPRSRCTAARAPTTTRARRNTQRSATSSRRSRSRCSPTVISTTQGKRAEYLISLKPTG